MVFLKNKEGDLGEGKELSKGQMEKLLKLARITIKNKLDGKSVPMVSEAKELLGSDFNAVCKEQGAFVTLEYEGQLRGCIGSLMPEGPLWENIRSNALNAAFNDPRFYSLSTEEYSKVEIEISVLSPLYKMKFSSPQDLLSKLEPNVHGVLLRFANGAGATYLPQVWEDIPQKEEFLSELCRKAGMERDSWKGGGLEVFVYTVQMAKEAK